MYIRIKIPFDRDVLPAKAEKSNYGCETCGRYDTNGNVKISKWIGRKCSAKACKRT